MAITITLDDGTTVECATATIAKNILVDAIREERGATGIDVRFKRYQDAVKAKMEAYGLGNLDKYRNAINTLIKVRLSMEKHGYGHPPYGPDDHIKSSVGRDINGRALSILDELLPTPKEAADVEG